MSKLHNRGSSRTFWMAACLLSACDLVEDPTVESQSMAIRDGVPVPPGTQAYDDVVITGYTYNYAVIYPNCTGTLLTNKWVLSAQHCQSPDANNMFVVYYPETFCSLDSQCARSGQCITEVGRCGARVPNGAIVNNPKAYPPPPELHNQVQLWYLARPIQSAQNPTDYSIAQQVWYGTKASLLNKTLTIVGGGESAPPQTTGTFTVTSVKPTWSYLVNSNTYAIVQGDSGGPGYYYANGVHYLTGVTVTPAIPGTPGSQHDLVEVWTGGTMRGWIEDTLFSAPNAIQSNAQGFAMALTSTGAVQAFVRNGSYYFSQCDSEPCDQRGAWSTPGLTAVGRSAAPAIAIDTIPGWGLAGAQVFIADTAGVTAHAVVKGAYLYPTELGGSCTSPAGAYSRPQTDPPILDVVCRGTDGNLYINHRVNNAYWGWGSIGKPSAGIRSGIAPAVVAIDQGTVYVAVAGSDGQVYIQPGRGDVGWTGWTSLGNPWGRSLRSVALASYAPERLDVIAVDSGGKMWQRIATGNTLGKNWNSTWSEITGRTWSSSVPPFAASYGWKYGLMNVGGIGTDGNAHIQRYSDW